MRGPRGEYAKLAGSGGGFGAWSANYVLLKGQAETASPPVRRGRYCLLLSFITNPPAFI
jgi:hypothetical protein